MSVQVRENGSTKLNPFANEALYQLSYDPNIPMNTRTMANVVAFYTAPSYTRQNPFRTRFMNGGPGNLPVLHGYQPDNDARWTFLKLLPRWTF